MRNIIFGGIIITALTMAWSATAAEIKVSSVSHDWVAKKAEIQIVLDSSTSIFIDDFKDMAKFVADMVSEMDIGSTKTRIGIGTYADKYREYISLANDQSKTDLVNAIRDSPLYSGEGIMADGLEGMRAGLSLNVTRKGVPRIGLIFTDGDYRFHQAATDASILLKKEGVHLFIVGIGRDADVRRIRPLASEPKADTVYWVPDFASFSDIKRNLMSNMAEVEFRQADESSCGKTKKADIFFVYDELNLGMIKSEYIKDFITGVAKELSIDSGHIRAGVLSQNCRPDDIELNQFFKRDEFINQGVKREKDNQGLAYLVNKAKNRLIDPTYGSRTFANDYIILFVTEEAKKEMRNLIGTVRRAKYSGIKMFVVEINSGFAKEAIKIMVDDESSITSPTSYDDLKKQKQTFMDNFCQEIQLRA